MTSVKQIAGVVALGALLLGLSSASAQADPVPAPYVVTLRQQGEDVVASGSGAFDLTGLAFSFSGALQPGISPNIASFVTGVTGVGADTYTFLVGPANFGNGNGGEPSSGSGDIVGVIFNEALLVPHNYVSNSLLSSSSTYFNTTFAELGVALGQYVWSWGSGAN